jgi:hypothetical protein
VAWPTLLKLVCLFLLKAVVQVNSQVVSPLNKVDVVDQVLSRCHPTCMAFQASSLRVLHTVLNRVTHSSSLPCNKLNKLLLSLVAVADLVVAQFRVFQVCLPTWLACQVNHKCSVASLKVLDKLDQPVVVLKVPAQLNIPVVSLPKLVAVCLPKCQVCL